MTKLLGVAVVASCGVIVGCSQAFIGPDDIVVASPGEFVSGARQLIEQYADVYFYVHSVEEPESPDNIP